LASPNDSTNSIGEIKTSIQKHLSEIHTNLPSTKVPLTMPYTSAAELIKDAQQVKKQIEDKYKVQNSLLK